MFGMCFWSLKRAERRVLASGDSADAKSRSSAYAKCLR